MDNFMIANKAELLLAGKRIGVTDKEMDYLEQDERLYKRLASIPNPNQVGTKDRLIAFLK